MAERMFRAWYTHEWFELPLSRLLKLAKTYIINLENPDNPTIEEIERIYQAAFTEMSDPWEVTANGECHVQEIRPEKGKEWNNLFDFIEEAVGESPHSGDDATMTWFKTMMEKLRASMDTLTASATSEDGSSQMPDNDEDDDD